MITKFKIYESINEGDPEVGDYVIIYADDFDQPLIDFFKDNIGKIMKINDAYSHRFGWTPFYTIEFDKSIPFSTLDVLEPSYNIDVLIEEIKYWSKNKEDLKTILIQQKFNL